MRAAENCASAAATCPSALSTRTRGRPPTATYKASATWSDGFRVGAYYMIAGIDAAAKADKVAGAVFRRSAELLCKQHLPPFTEIRSITVAEGRFYNYQDNDAGRRVAFLGSDSKKQLFAEREAIGQAIQLNGIPYTVIGVMKTKDQNSSYDGVDIRKVFIPFNSMKRDFPNKPPAVEHTVDRLLVAPWSLATHRDCARIA